MSKELSRRKLTTSLINFSLGFASRLPQGDIGPDLVEMYFSPEARRAIALVRSILEIKNLAEEAYHLGECGSILEVRELTPFLTVRELRLEALVTSWDNRKYNDKEILRPELKAICDEFAKIKVSLPEAAQEILGPGIPYEVMFYAVKADKSRLFPVSPIFTAAIITFETNGTLNLGSARVSDRYQKPYTEYFSNVRGPFGINLNLQKYPHRIPCNDWGALGLPQVMPNTFNSIKRNLDGSYPNPLSLADAPRIVNDVLVGKTWQEDNKEKCKEAFRKYGGDYHRAFDTLWKLDQKFKGLASPLMTNPDYKK